MQVYNKILRDLQKNVTILHQMTHFCSVAIKTYSDSAVQLRMNSN